MICDAHIHVGYFDRKGHYEPFYYSPRRVCSVLRRCGVDEFIFSSTSMQTKGIVFSDVHREAREVVKIWGQKAHPFLWVTNSYLDYDPKLSCLNDGVYEGLKLHGRETPWLSSGMGRKLARVLEVAAEREVPVVVHTGLDGSSHPRKWLKWAKRYSTIQFDFAHCTPPALTQQCLGTADNVFADISCVRDDDVAEIARIGCTDRILWGTDFPALSARVGTSLARDLRSEYRRCAQWSTEFDFAMSFQRFLDKE